MWYIITAINPDGTLKDEGKWTRIENVKPTWQTYQDKKFVVVEAATDDEALEVFDMFFEASYASARVVTDYEGSKFESRRNVPARLSLQHKMSRNLSWTWRADGSSRIPGAESDDGYRPLYATGWQLDKRTPGPMVSFELAMKAARRK